MAPVTLHVKVIESPYTTAFRFTLVVSVVPSGLSVEDGVVDIGETFVSH